MDRRYFSHGGNEPVLLFITSASILAEIQRIVSNEDEWRVRAKRWTCFLANLEKQGKRVDIFTQNIDGLHKKAGSQHVYELHGSIQTATCPSCGSTYELPYLLQEEVPVCERISSDGRTCGRVLKTDVVLFGDMVKHFDQVEKSLLQTDMLLVMGTSLEVAPARYIPEDAAHHPSIFKVMMNLSETEFDPLFDLVFHERIGELVNAL